MDSLTSLEEVYSEWQNNPQFKEEFKKDPKATLEKWGFKLSDADLKRILQLKNDNEELDKRVNK
ncbi:MAG: hypothetical protein ACYCQI_05880 [Gammaproteobacteria bacterium]